VSGQREMEKPVTKMAVGVIGIAHPDNDLSSGDGPPMPAIQ